MPDRSDYVMVSEGGVTIEYAREDASTPGTPDTYQTLGTPKGTWNFGDSKATVEDDITNWFTVQQSALLATATAGTRTIDATGTIEMILDDAGYLALVADYESSASGGQEGFLKVTFTDNDAGNTEVLDYKVIALQLNRNANETGTSDIALSFRINEVVPSGGWGS